MSVEPEIRVNPAAALNVRLVGQERHKVLIFDDFATDTETLRSFAAAGDGFEPVSSQYPGLRRPLPGAYVRATLNALHQRLFRTYRVPRDRVMRVVNAAFSLVTVPEAELSVPQRSPHVDSLDPHYLAILHYLNPGPFCDTGLFRHRATGFESLSEARREAYADAREAWEAGHGEPAARYLKDGNGEFELYERIAYRPNRLVVYPGCLLHSSLVDAEVDLDPDPRTGRLTANLFVDFTAP